MYEYCRVQTTENANYAMDDVLRVVRRLPRPRVGIVRVVLVNRNKNREYYPRYDATLLYRVYLSNLQSRVDLIDWMNEYFI